MHDLTIIVDPADTSKCAPQNKTHLVKRGDHVVFTAYGKSEALTWLDGYKAALDFTLNVLKEV